MAIGTFFIIAQHWKKRAAMLTGESVNSSCDICAMAYLLYNKRINPDAHDNIGENLKKHFVKQKKPDTKEYIVQN